MAVFAKNLRGQLVVRGPGLSVVEIQGFKTLREEDLVLVEESRPDENSETPKNLSGLLSEILEPMSGHTHNQDINHRADQQAECS